MGFYIYVEKDIKVYVEDINTSGKETVFFVHGWPGNHNLFEYQFNYLPKMGYRCIGIDYRGFGNSDRPWTGYDYNRLADDIRCVVNAMDLHCVPLQHQALSNVHTSNMACRQPVGQLQLLRTHGFRKKNCFVI